MAVLGPAALDGIIPKLPACQSSLGSTQTQPVHDRPWHNVYIWQDREAKLVFGSVCPGFLSKLFLINSTFISVS